MLGFLCLVFLQCLHLNVNKIVYNDDAFLFLWWFVDRVKWGKKFPDQFVVVCEKEFEGIYNVYLVDSNCILRFLNYTPWATSSPYPFLPHTSFHIPSFPPTLNLSYTHTNLSSRTHPFIYSYFPFLSHLSFYIPSFPSTLILSYNFLSSQIQPFYIYPYLPFIPHSLFRYLPFLPRPQSSLNTPYFHPTLILSYKSILFPSSHTHPTFPNLILFLFLSQSSNLSKPHSLLLSLTLIQPFRNSSSSSTLTLIQPWINPFLFSFLLNLTFPKPILDPSIPSLVLPEGLTFSFHVRI